MTSRYDVFLNGVALSSIHPDLRVADIQYQQPTLTPTKNAFAKRQGAVISRYYKEKTAVTVPFELHIYNPAERQRALQDVNAWARSGGYLETTDRPGQRLWVMPDAPAVISSAHRWTDTINISFSAYLLPYWEETDPVTVPVPANSSSTAFVPGNVASVLTAFRAVFTASASSLTVSLGDKQMTLSGLNFAENDVVEATHDENLFLHITLNGVSILDHRTGADELTAVCGQNNTFSVSGPATVTFTVRGLWQ